MRPTLLYRKKGARKAKAKRPPKYRTEAKAAFKAAYESLFGSQGAASLINWEPRSHPRGSAAPTFSPSPPSPKVGAVIPSTKIVPFAWRLAFPHMPSLQQRLRPLLSTR